MANQTNTSSNDKWYFTKEQLENTPSRKCGYDSHKELSYRQQAANFIQDMGQRLKVSQLCINTAIVYMHRFYVFHSFTHFPWYQMAAAALFLAAKVEEQPRKLEYVIRVANICRNARDTSIDLNSERYIAQSQDLVFNENVLLQTLGFDVAIDHPHTHVVRCCHLVRASKDLAQTSYFMASNSLHLTTMCIQYKPTVVACFCILVACKWSNWEIPLSNEKKEWYSYVDPTVTAELLQQLTEEFLVIFEACPSRLKEKIMAIADNVAHMPSTHINSPFDTDPKKIIREDGKDVHSHRSSGSESDLHKHRSNRPHEPGSSNQQQRDRDRNRERLAAHQKAALMSGQSKVPHGHHRPPVDPKLKPHSRPSSMGGYHPSNRTEPKEILRDAARDSPFGLPNKEYRDPTRDHGKDMTSRDPQLVRGDKDLQKRDNVMKSNIQTEMNSSGNFAESRVNFSVDKQRIETNNRSRMDPSKVFSNKPDTVNKHEETKPYLKLETENIKKHLSAGSHDKNSVLLSKSLISNSQKLKSSFSADSSKSVLNVSQINVASKIHHQNGSSFDPPMTHNEGKIKTEPVSLREKVPTPPTIKKPSMFSPEKTPPHKKNVKSPSFSKKSSESSFILGTLSPITSPIGSRRSRNYSSSSEPELRPVMKKIDQMEGFENLMRDNTIGINKISKVSNVLPLIDIKPDPASKNFSEKDKQAPAIPVCGTENVRITTVVNGMETNPTIISNLLKEAPSALHLPSVGLPDVTVANLQTIGQLETEVRVEKEYHHHKSKKKNKEKHKHKDRSKDDKEKKKKHKDKDREKHKHKDRHDPLPQVVTTVTTEPIKIKIQKDKIQPMPESSTPCPPQGLKIKIPKDKIKTESLTELAQPLPGGGIKLKIPKEKLGYINPDSSRKRERDRSTLCEAPPIKISKTSHKDSKQNGRHYYNKVSASNSSNFAHSSYPPNLAPNHMLPPRSLYPPPPPPPPPPSVPTDMYFFHRQVPPPCLPNMSVPPPGFVYPESGSIYPYYHQGYMYPPEMFQQQPPPPLLHPSNSNPPLPTDAPPNFPPPPPPE